MTVNKKSAAVDYLKAMAAVLVVLHHAIVYPGAEKTSPVWLAVLNLISAVHVPLFFAVAGYLCHRQPLKQYLQKKASRILVPFFFFSTLKLVYSGLVSSEFAHGTSLGEQLFDAYILGNLYWFPYSIMLSYCAATLFWTEKDTPPAGKKRWLLPVFLLCLFAVNIPADLSAVKSLSVFQFGSTLYFFLFFLLGLLIRQYRDPLSRFLQRHQRKIIPLCLLIVCVLPWILVLHRGWHTHLARLAMALPGMLVLYWVSRKLPPGLTVLNMLGKYSLQIMFMDSFWKVVLFAVLQPFIGADVLLIPLCTAANLALSCLACRIIEKIPGIRFLVGL